LKEISLVIPPQALSGRWARLNPEAGEVDLEKRLVALLHVQAEVLGFPYPESLIIWSQKKL
jgi:hypothetical protein